VTSLRAGRWPIRASLWSPGSLLIDRSVHLIAMTLNQMSQKSTLKKHLDVLAWLFNIR
jgi:hypothetical protein